MYLQGYDIPIELLQVLYKTLAVVRQQSDIRHTFLCIWLGYAILFGYLSISQDILKKGIKMSENRTTEIVFDG